MHVCQAFLLRVLAALCLATASNLSVAATMFNETSFSQLTFLEGRWKGVGPDGKDFFDEYVLASASLFRSIRHADAGFSKPTDESTVELKDGVITSTWGPFTWKATSVSAFKACFDPVNAPSSFCWERVAPDTVTVTQRWTDSNGAAQSFVLTLNRVAR